MSTKTKILAGIGREHYASRVNIRNHQLITDEPLDNGGQDLGPTPTELILSGLASCTASTLRMYADKKGWNVEGIDLEVSIAIRKTDTGQISHIDTVLEIMGEVSGEQKERLLEIARKCPLYRLLTNPVEISTSLKEQAQPG